MCLEKFSENKKISFYDNQCGSLQNPILTWKN